MRKADRRSLHTPPARAPEKQSPLDEVQALFERVKRHSEAERQAAKSHGPMARLLLALTLAAGLIAAATLCYGIYHFPDAPIRQTADGYEGKGGNARSREDFEAFILWEKAILVVFPSLFGLGFVLVMVDRMQRRKDKR